MNLLRKLIPPFLVQWDLYLLQHMPRLWATRVHYHLWFLFLLNGIAFGLGMVLRVNTRRCPDPEELFAYMMVPAVAYFAFWVYRVVRFTVEKRFGIRKPYAEVGEFFVHLLSILLILTIPYTLSTTVAWRISVLTSDAEFAEEVELLNQQAPWFYGLQEHWEYSRYEYDDDYADNDLETATVAATLAMEAAIAIDQDLQALHNSAQARSTQGDGTHRFFRNYEEYRHRDALEADNTSEVLPLHQLYTSYINNGNQALDDTDSAHYDLDSAAFYFAKADSVERNFPLLYVNRGAFTPAYFDHPAEADSLREEAYLRSYAAHEPMDRAAVDRALAIGYKYARRVRVIGSDSVAAEFEHRTSSSTNLLACGPQMTRIARAKSRSYAFFLPELIAFGMLLPCFALALLISIFKNNYWQPFLIAVVAGFLTPVLVAIFALLTEHGVFAMNDGDIMVYAHWWICALLVLTPLTIPSMQVYRTYRAVMLILGNAIIPFFPVFTLAILNMALDVFGIQALENYIAAIEGSNPMDLRLGPLQLQLHELNQYMEFVGLCTLWGGMALYAFVLHPLYRTLHARMIALPETR